MIRAVLLLAAMAAPAGAVEVAVPSGQSATLQEVLVEQLGDETWLRFRFLTPQITRGTDGVTYDVAFEDMTHLCDALALPYMDEHALQGDVIVLSFADRPVEFGQADPDATQFFEAFRPVDNTCIWEAL